MLEPLKALVASDFSAVNQLIVDKINTQIELIAELSQHILNSGGKRIRPLLVLLSSHACNYQGRDHIVLAAMIEFFHTATLLHDDVVDDSTLRRGKETANEIWGSKASILVGDYLFTQSVKLMVSINQPKVLHLLADTSHQISCGEIKQLANRHNLNLNFTDYLEVIRAKTALLFAASASIGPILNNCDESTEKNLYNYGLHLGQAFQLIDDALDYCSDAATIGKNIGDDLADGKLTLPLLRALELSNPTQKELITESIRSGKLLNLDAIIKAINDTDAINFTRNCAAAQVSQAISALEILPNSVYKNALIDLANFALERTF